MAARATVSIIPGLAKVLATDWKRAARFYARDRITEKAFRQGVPVSQPRNGEGFSELLGMP